MKNQKGITLVALVITIIVLLILAGVSLSLVVGQNGILTQSTSAVKSNKAASAKQALSLSISAMEAKYYSKWVQNQSLVRSEQYSLTDLAGELGNQGYVVYAIQTSDNLGAGQAPTDLKGTQITRTEPLRDATTTALENEEKLVTGLYITLYIADSKERDFFEFTLKIEESGKITFANDINEEEPASGWAEKKTSGARIWDATKYVPVKGI